MSLFDEQMAKARATREGRAGIREADREIVLLRVRRVVRRVGDALFGVGGLFGTRIRHTLCALRGKHSVRVCLSRRATCMRECIESASAHIRGWTNEQ